MKIDILVLNYNGKHLIEKFFPSVIRAAAGSRHQCRAAIVDNLSSDASLGFIRGRFPSTQVFSSSKNEVICSFNEILKLLDSDIVIMLNNDIEVKDDFVDYLADHFQEEDVFFAAPRLLNFDNTYNGGRSYLHFKFGILRNEVDMDGAALPADTHSIGTGAFRRSDFLQLGGFDRLYLPGIWEEVDLCYRALLRGKKGVYEPRSIIWHQESTTFNKEYGQRRKMVLAHRNMFLFFWKNISDPGLILQHIFFLPFRIIHSFICGKSELAEGFFRALPRLPAILIKRRQEPQAGPRILKDRDIIR